MRLPTTLAQWETAAAVSAVLAALATIVVSLRRSPVGRFFRGLSRNLALLNPLRFSAAIERIDREFRPNGGASTYDKIEGLRETVATIEARQALTSAVSRATFRAQPGLAWLALPTGEHEDATDELVRFSGRTADELRGAGWRSSLHPEDRERIVGAYLAALSLGIPFEDHARFLVRVGPTGLVDVPARISATPSRIGGRIVAYVGRLYPDDSPEEINAAVERVLARQRPAPPRRPPRRKPGGEGKP